MIYLITFVSSATFVMFNQSMYSVNEGAGVVRPVVVISKSSDSPISVQVTSMDGSATGEYCSV